MTAVVDAAAISVPMAMVMGLAFGAGPCNITCLPYLGPVFVAAHHARRQAWRVVAPFSAGRLLSYAMLGLLAGYLGQALESWLTSALFGWMLGLATMAVGVTLLLRQFDRSSQCRSSSSKNSIVTMSTTGNTAPQAPATGLFVMGAGMALNPCAPLAAILVAAAASGSAGAGAGLGLGFGVGAVVVPSIVFALGVAHLGRQLREHMAQWRPYLERTAAVLMIVLGAGAALGWMRP